MSRYVVWTCDGFIGGGVPSHSTRSPGRSYVVLDSLVCYRLMGEFKSEHARSYAYARHSPKRERAIAVAREAAEALAARLNG